MTIKFNQADVADWFAKARDDVLFARSSRTSGFWRHVCFTCQQAAEKALKAYMYSLQDDFDLKEIRVLKTHRLQNLIRFSAQRKGKLTEDIIEASKTFDQYYLPTRYPDVPDPIGTYTQELAEDALAKAEVVVNGVGALLGIATEI